MIEEFTGKDPWKHRLRPDVQIEYIPRTIPPGLGLENEVLNLTLGGKFKITLTKEGGVEEFSREVPSPKHAQKFTAELEAEITVDLGPDEVWDRLKKLFGVDAEE